MGRVKSIAIPVFDNETTEYGLAELVTSEVSQAFVANNTLKVMPESQSDAVLEGTVVKYSRDPYTYTAGETVQEYICRVGLKIKVRNNKTDKAIWEGELDDFGTFNVSTESETDGKTRAIQKLVDQILNKTVKGW